MEARKVTTFAFAIGLCATGATRLTAQSVSTGEIRGVLERMAIPVVRVELRSDQAGPPVQTTDALDLASVPPSRRRTFEFKGLSSGPYFVRAPAASFADVIWGPSERVVWVRSGESTVWKWAPLACPEAVQATRPSDDDIAAVVRIALTIENQNPNEPDGQFNLLVDDVPVPALKNLPAKARLVTRTELRLMASRAARGMVPYVSIDIKETGECISATVRFGDEFFHPPAGLLSGGWIKYLFKRNGAYWDFDDMGHAVS